MCAVEALNKKQYYFSENMFIQSEGHVYNIWESPYFILSNMISETLPLIQGQMKCNILSRLAI